VAGAWLTQTRNGVSDQWWTLISLALAQAQARALACVTVDSDQESLMLKLLTERCHCERVVNRLYQSKCQSGLAGARLSVWNVMVTRQAFKCQCSGY
jgi:hypothetical protein